MLFEGEGIGFGWQNFPNAPVEYEQGRHRLLLKLGDLDFEIQQQPTCFGKAEDRDKHLENDFNVICMLGKEPGTFYLGYGHYEGHEVELKCK